MDKGVYACMHTAVDYFLTVCASCSGAHAAACVCYGCGGKLALHCLNGLMLSQVSDLQSFHSCQLSYAFHLSDTFQPARCGISDAFDVLTLQALELAKRQLCQLRRGTRCLMESNLCRRS